MPIILTDGERATSPTSTVLQWFQRETMAYLRSTLDKQSAWLAHMRVLEVRENCLKVSPDADLGASEMTIHVRLPRRYQPQVDDGSPVTPTTVIDSHTEECP